MRTLMCVACAFAMFATGCSSDPLKFRLDDKTVESLPVDKLQEARLIKEQVDAAKRKWEVAKVQQRLVAAEWEAAKRFAQAAEFHLEATREKLDLQNKGVPMGMNPGALEEATEDLDLAKKNLEYRRILGSLHERQVKHLFMNYHSLRAHYFETTVGVMIAANHEKAKDLKKSDFVRQSAQRKTLVAETLEALEKGETTIKALADELKKRWAPRLSCASSAARPCPEPKCPECRCPAPSDPRRQPPAGDQARPAAADQAQPPAGDQAQPPSEGDE